MGLNSWFLIQLESRVGSDPNQRTEPCFLWIMGQIEGGMIQQSDSRSARSQCASPRGDGADPSDRTGVWRSGTEPGTLSRTGAAGGWTRAQERRSTPAGSPWRRRWASTEPNRTSGPGFCSGTSRKSQSSDLFEEVRSGPDGSVRFCWMN